MTDVMPLPPPKKETPYETTLRLMRTKPDLRDGMAFQLWCYESGRWAGTDARAEWDSWPSYKREDWERFTIKRYEWYVGLSPVERQKYDDTSWKRQLDINERTITSSQPSE